MQKNPKKSNFFDVENYFYWWKYIFLNSKYSDWSKRDLFDETIKIKFSHSAKSYDKNQTEITEIYTFLKKRIISELSKIYITNFDSRILGIESTLCLNFTSLPLRLSKIKAVKERKGRFISSPIYDCRRITVMILWRITRDTWIYNFSYVFTGCILESLNNSPTFQGEI